MKNKFIIAMGSNINSPEGFNPIENCNKAISELYKFNIESNFNIWSFVLSSFGS